MIFGDNVDKVKEDVQKSGGTLTDLGFGFGIVNISLAEAPKIFELKSINYIELPKAIYTSSQEGNKASCIEEVSSFSLTGEGVLVGFVDSGIDYLHKAFINEQGNTRIDSIFDLSLGGKIYTEDDINKALKSKEPYTVVPSRDEASHGTHVAGIACAGGDIDKRYYGVAPKSLISMVKMAPSGKLNFSQSTQLMKGIKYLIDRARTIGKPLAVNLSYSSSSGAHDGSSILERYIETCALLERVTIVASSGNEGDAAHHIAGELKENQNFLFNMAQDETGLMLEIYKDILDNLMVEIKNPKGESTGVIRLKEGTNESNLMEDSIFIYVSGARPLGTSSEVIISLFPRDSFLMEGVWSFTIYSDRTRGGRFDIWMPVSEGLNPKTKFLNPEPLNTLGLPATVSNVISVGSYNTQSGSVSTFSGRGGKTYSYIKPDILAPGENIESSISGGDFDVKSGTSMSAPFATGSSALLMEWGIVKGKDSFLYGNRLKYFLIKGAIRDRLNLIYPDDAYGYGKLCLKNSLNLLELTRERKIMNNRISCGEFFTSDKYNNYLVEYDGDISKYTGEDGKICAFKLDENYAVFAVLRDSAEEILKNTKEIIYIEKNSLYTLCYTSPLEAAKINFFHKNQFLNLTGQGVLVGIVDTGVNYLSPELSYEDNTSRILKIWDQSEDKIKAPQGFNFGAEYTKEEIDKAISESLKGGDPYKIVPEKDLNGHGTFSAVLIGGRGKKPEFEGGAPECEFFVVKLREGKKGTLSDLGVGEVEEPVYESTNVLLAIKYLYNEAARLNKPMVIYVPVQSNMGGHDGNSILERFIDDISKERGLVVTVPSGNEGDTETHTEGKFLKNLDTQTIEFKVDPMQKNLNIQVWCKKPDKVSIGIVSPSGEIIKTIPAKLKETEEINLVFEGSNIKVRYFLPEEISGDELIDVNIQNIREGLWQFRLTGDYIVDGTYDAYMPQRPLIKEGTKFLRPSQYTTVTIPGSGKTAITAGAYNQNDNASVSFTGRGKTRDGRIKPDLCAGGINVLSQGASLELILKSGTSVSCAVLCAACILLLQWGIVQGNDVTLYSPKLKVYLIRGTEKRKGDIYPDDTWGYGILNLVEVFKNIRDLNYKNIIASDIKKDEHSKIFISIPESLKTKLNIKKLK